MKKLILSAFTIGFIAIGINAQESEDLKPCGINEAEVKAKAHLEGIFDKHPHLRAEHERMLKLLKNSKVSQNKNGGPKSNHYVIPTVWHIIHEYGNENLDDALIYASMDKLNEQWQHDDADSTLIIPEFKQIAGGLNIEFRLANIDPYGNCTNGIEHIYSHETRVGDDLSKLHQWDRSSYLNIWVTVGMEGAPSAAAYSYGPESTDGFGFYIDGVISRVAYATSAGSETTMTHEVAHWLNISHVWGPTNEPEVQCGDDGVADTPITQGHSGNGGCNYAWLSGPANRVCDTSVIENAQNYMDYAGCGRMFTQGQMLRAENALNSISGGRINLWNDTTLAATGTHDTSTVQLCTPVADFNTPDTRICVGATATFTDHSWNAVVDNRTWTFQDGTPATSTSPIANVTFNSPGWKSITLEVSNASGSDTKTMTNYIYVSPDWADFTGPASLDIEGNQEYLFLVENPEDNWARFDGVDGVGYDGSKAFRLNNYKDISDADPFTSEGNYYNNLGRSMDYLITPSFDLRNTTGVTVGFWYSYASANTNSADVEEVLKVYSSRNCGESWLTRKTITGSQLLSGGFAGGDLNFVPSNNQMWQYAEFTYTPTSQDNRTRFMFEFEASDRSNNLYIDNINVNGTLSITAQEIQDLELIVFPNPTKGEAINVRYTAQNESVKFILRDITGKVISTETVNTTNSSVTHRIEGSANLPSAPYFLEVRSGDYSTTKKIVVL